MDEEFLKYLDNLLISIKKDFINFGTSDEVENVDSIEVHFEVGFEEFNGLNPIKYKFVKIKNSKEA